jgi:hypothetical protein
MQIGNRHPASAPDRNVGARSAVHPDVDMPRGPLLSVLLLVVTVVVGSASGARGQNFAAPDADRYFRVEWAAAQSARRGPVIRGYVYETYGRSSDQMRLAIDTLDASEKVTGTILGYVMGAIPGGGRAYFEIPVPTVGGYRVRIVSFRWTHLGGGGP